MSPIYSAAVGSPVGTIRLAANERALVGLWLEGQKYFCDKYDLTAFVQAETPVLSLAEDWLKAYFNGEQPEPSSLPLEPMGSDFRRLVWSLLLRIPYGTTVSYSALASDAARRLGKACVANQALGGAVGHNPISIIIPCHRVVGADGSLTGYAGGLDKKAALLRHEGADMSRLYMPRKGSAL